MTKSVEQLVDGCEENFLTKGQFTCMCNSHCTLPVAVPCDVMERVITEHLFVISDDCKHGPEPDDVLLETHEGFKIYENEKWE